jgi:molybdopterin-biosynthesis enzyme MoeA-like protein
VKHDLRGGRPMLSRTVSCHLPEGVIAQGLGEVQSRYGELDIGSYPFYRRGEFGTSLVLRGRAAARVDAAKDEVIALVKGLGGEPVEE